MPEGNPSEPSSADCSTGAEASGWIRSDGRNVWSALDDGSTAARDRITALVHTLELDVIPRLVQWHRGAGGGAGAVPSGAELLRFVDLVIEGGEPQIAESIDRLRRRGVSVETIFLELLGPAARRLGEMWTDDRCDFSTVTVGLGRIQRVLRELSPAFGSEVAAPPNGRRLFLTQPDDEQHSLGLCMVAEFFRRSGWAVDGGLAGSGIDPVAAVQRDWYDVVGFSVGSDKRTEWVTARVAALRRASRNSAVAVLVGGPLFTVHPEWGSRVGADATVTDGRAAPDVAESLLASRAKSGPGTPRSI
jgi:MerR family transcriptional regulator, light-induced transcriptional regulator